MPGLLDLPSELLYQIIEYVDSSPLTLPLDGKRHRPERLLSRAVICYPVSEPARSLHRGLLLTNRRMHSETLHYTLKQQRGFELDVAIVNDHWIWPMWRYIPRQQADRAIARLNINIIYCATKEERRIIYEEDTILITQSCLEFLMFVSDFLINGICGAQTISPAANLAPGRPKKLKDFRIKTLAINVDTSRYQDGTETISTVDIPFRTIQGLGHLNFDLLYPIDATKCCLRVEEFGHITNSALHRVAAGLVIRERVEKILFFTDGCLKEEIDITEYMKKKREDEIAEYKRRNLAGA
jgi:hypothetical protein